MRGGLLPAVLWVGLFAIIFSDILQNDMSENQSAGRGRRFPSYEALTFWVSLVILFVAVWAWLNPKEPVPTPRDPDQIYKDGKPIGHVTFARIEPTLMGQYTMLLDEHQPLRSGDVLEFRNLHCVIMEIQEDVPKGTMQERIDCRIIGH